MLNCWDVGRGLVIHRGIGVISGEWVCQRSSNSRSMLYNRCFEKRKRSKLQKPWPRPQPLKPLEPLNNISKKKRLRINRWVISTAKTVAVSRTWRLIPTEPMPEPHKEFRSIYPLNLWNCCRIDHDVLYFLFLFSQRWELGIDSYRPRCRYELVTSECVKKKKKEKKRKVASDLELDHAWVFVEGDRLDGWRIRSRKRI